MLSIRNAQTGLYNIGLEMSQLMLIFVWLYSSNFIFVYHWSYFVYTVTESNVDSLMLL